ncbi:YdcF family protein [Litoribacterium kuwaitense]|uniref:YdcF family protein n=1 Tax=Litoribacterium kuwaitense TaxID=1398745 RepID=UPI001FECE1E7|nr:YdcF family protein [Litoribacterium kuwaitense]
MIFLLIISLATPLIFFIWMHSFSVHAKDADALIILGYQCKNDQVHPLLKERLDAALALMERYHYKKIILTGGAVTSTKTEADIMKAYLINQGVRAEDILLETKARNTVFNIVYCKTILRQHDLHSTLLISNSFHMRRMKYITKKLHFPTAFYAPRTLSSLAKQVRMTFAEIKAFKLTLPWLEKVTKTDEGQKRQANGE